MKAACIMVAFMATILSNNPVHAQTTEAPASAASQSPFHFSSTSGAIEDNAFFVNFAAQMGVEWSQTVQETLTVSGSKVKNQAQRDAAAAILSRIPEGAKAVFQYLGEQAHDSAPFAEWLKSRHQCEFVSRDEELGIETWTPGCDTAATQMSAIVLQAIQDSSANAVIKGNATFTHDKAMKLSGDEKVAMLHLAALMLPFSEWVSAYGLTDDLNLLVGKPACFLPSGEEARCGSITAADANGVTINGETVPWTDILGEGPGLGIGNVDRLRENWGKGHGAGSGSNPNAGLVPELELGYGMTFTPNLTATHLFHVGGAFQFNLASAPIAFRLSGGVLGLVSGGMADHYTERASAGDRWMGYFTAGVGYVPMFSEHVGFNVMPKGVVTTSGGGGLLVDIGPTFYLGKDSNFVLAPMVSAGYLDLNRSLGGNPTSPLADPTVGGFTLDLSLTAGWKF